MKLIGDSEALSLLTAWIKDGQDQQVESASTDDTEIESSNDESQVQDLVAADDYIYRRGRLSPVVIERYKLVFFFIPKNACTVWKLLFQRMLQVDIDQSKQAQAAVHDPSKNGLVYLYDYNLTAANAMMRDPSWTKAIFVRSPHERLLSAYLDKGVGTEFRFVHKACCRQKMDCLQPGHQSLADFLNVSTKCFDQHWMPQAYRVTAKLWPMINYVGHMESLAEDAEQLLRRIGAWDDFGATGWGLAHNESIFSTGDGRKHATSAKERLDQYYDDELRERVSQVYWMDYESPYMNLSLPI